MTLLLSYQDVEGLFTIEDCLRALEAAYLEQSEDLAVNRPRSHSYLPTDDPDTFYMLKSMGGGLARSGYAAIRLNSEIVWYGEIGGIPRKEQLPTVGSGRWLEMVLLFDTRKGDLLAIMPGGYIQSLRMAVTSALGAKYLARKNSRVLGLYGTGWQARAQVLAHRLVRPLEEIRVYSPNPEHRRSFAEEMSALADVPITAVDTPEEVMRGADMVVTATNASTPVVLGERLEPGMWFTCIKNEVNYEAVRRSDVIVIHQRWGSEIFWPTRYTRPGTPPPKPEMQEYNLDAFGTSRLETNELPDLRDLMTGKVPGRTSDEQITFFYTNAGWGIQFAASAGVTYEKARQRGGVGRELPLDWFLQDVHP